MFLELLDPWEWYIRINQNVAKYIYIYTHPKFNIAPEKWWLEDYFPIGMAYFQGLR